MIRRLATLISRVARLEASNSALESQARGQSDQLLQRMSKETAGDDQGKGKKVSGGRGERG